MNYIVLGLKTSRISFLTRVQVNDYARQIDGATDGDGDGGIGCEENDSNSSGDDGDYNDNGGDDSGDGGDSGDTKVDGDDK